VNDDAPTAVVVSSPSVEEPHRAVLEFVDRAADSSDTDGLRPLLCARLRVAAIALGSILVAFFVRNLFVVGAPLSANVSGALIALLTAALVVLYAFDDLSLRQLRLIELIVFGVPAFRIALENYLQILQTARGGNADLVVAQMYATTLLFFAITAFYGMFVPNTVRRASIVIGSYGVVFILLLPIMSFHDPQAWQLVWQSVTFEQRSSMVMMMLFGVGISITASSIIQTLRTEVVEARQMGQYQLIERIGEGGMGEVWKAEHQLLARPAAVKLIRPEVLDPQDPARAEGMIRRFEREAQTTASLRSVHTVELYDFGITESGTLYFVMELLDGINLETLVKEEGPLSAARMRYLIRQVCDSLQEAHDSGLVHRDVKPANIFSCRLGGNYDFVKVLDFGLAKQHEPAGDDTVNLTREGMVIGTPAYMPPEVVTGGQADARSDIYALGCVMFWLLTGELLFEGAAPMSMIVRHAQAQPDPPSRRSELEIPESVDSIVLGCLEKNPGERPQTAEQVRRLLDACEIAEEWDESDARRWWLRRD